MPVPVIAAVAAKAVAAKAAAAVAAKAVASKAAAGVATKAAASTAVKTAATGAVKKKVATKALTKLKSIPGSVSAKTPKTGLASVKDMQSKQVEPSRFKKLATKLSKFTSQKKQSDLKWSEREGTINNLTPNGIPGQNAGGYEKQISLLDQ